MKKPLIAVTSSRRRALFTANLNRFALWRAGASSIRLYPGKTCDPQQIDGLLIGGGDDIDVRLYDHDLFLETRIDPERDRMEIELLEYALKHSLPVFGICRGAQILNVFLGGNLIQDIYQKYEGLRRQSTTLPKKWIDIHKESRLAAILKQDRCRVNSLHHQAIDQLGRGLTTVAHDQTRIIQAVENRDARFLVAVQWHPELLVFDSAQQNLFRTFVAAARHYQQERHTQ
ncbi:MAG: gamma-glutamyl-gamma-aminobutyrate hydrolase family protein [Pseudomonadota bacterium]